MVPNPFDSGQKSQVVWAIFHPKDNIPEPGQSDEVAERDLETMRRSEMLEVPWFDLGVSTLKSCLGDEHICSWYVIHDT